MINSKIKKDIVNIEKSSYKRNYAFIYKYGVVVKN